MGKVRPKSEGPPMAAWLGTCVLILLLLIMGGGGGARRSRTDAAAAAAPYTSRHSRQRRSGGFMRAWQSTLSDQGQPILSDHGESLFNSDIESGPDDLGVSNTTSVFSPALPNPLLSPLLVFDPLACTQEDSDDDSVSTTSNDCTSENAVVPDHNSPFLTHVPPRLLHPLYPNAKGGLTVGEHCLRECYKNLTSGGSRSDLREAFEFNSKIFNDMNFLTEYPCKVHEFWKLVGFHDETATDSLYEVCSFRHGPPSKPDGEYCDFVFPVLNHSERSAHVDPEHSCDECVCQKCKAEGRITRRFHCSSGGRVKPKAGGSYVGLQPGFETLLNRPDYCAAREAFFESRKGGTDTSTRGMRWHDSPNAKNIEETFSCTDPAARKNVTFFAMFWDYVELAKSSYSVGVLLCHPIDMLMRDVGKLQYTFVVALTIGPKKGGHFDAHNARWFQELLDLQTVGFNGHRFVCVKFYADRPAMENAAGLRGHNSQAGCGFCTGGGRFRGKCHSVFRV